MVFWRSKITKPAEPSAQAAIDEKADAKDDKNHVEDVREQDVKGPDASADADDAENSDDKEENSNVVSLVSNRLTERLAITTVSKEASAPLPAAQKSSSKSDTRRSSALERALAAPLEDGHVLVIAPAQSDRLQSIVETATACAHDLPAPKVWIAAAVGMASETIPVFAVPRDEASRLVMDANHALKRVAARLNRIAKSDDYKLSLGALAEERDHAIELPLEQLKRRAESQNIAIVKTLDGFVLAPMHDGRVVRQDVFRALPETLQRDVEAKISLLEAELQALVAREPEKLLAAEQKLEALTDGVVRQVASAEMAKLRTQFVGLSEAEPFLAYLEQAYLLRAQDWLLSGMSGPFEPGVIYSLSTAGKTPGVSGAAIVRVLDFKPNRLSGEIGRDADGRLVIRGGDLAAANGGFLILEAWRLAAYPQSWVSLSAALESGFVTPESNSGLIVDVAPVPLNLRLVLFSDETIVAKLEAIDPTIMKHFPTVVRLAAKEHQS